MYLCLRLSWSRVYVLVACFPLIAPPPDSSLRRLRRTYVAVHAKCLYVSRFLECLNPLCRATD
ncbi:hypothetical protein SCLCIDRAFT_1208151 [Scleroderma citrinum Foug A]|uniref:Secreted protein n=1 Tax=Scleroderma citrinum Foug A TaxID=1036808 RepID=A0A0C3AXG1_9AGAM|nr:hypothetical protein SCLCIDRAFT_1208151 [Scleroderma citrinum Foug A]